MLQLVFEDLIMLDDDKMVVLTNSIEVNIWALALRTASDHLKVKMQKKMRREKKDRINLEMAEADPVAVDDVEAAQQSIVDMTIALFGRDPLTYTQA